MSWLRVNRFCQTTGKVVLKLKINQSQYHVRHERFQNHKDLILLPRDFVIQMKYEFQCSRYPGYHRVQILWRFQPAVAKEKEEFVSNLQLDQKPPLFEVSLQT